ncbi:Hypothetical predicted protein [Paramuricea clavata]|uniref:Uncharacterized protein n=1 Tax=Paramuricea clavata TaxID=317549 RepID=A0A6S7GPL6_PARCT|nr:Hypothetical predicted protein [Paramuricea clavata]
MTKKRKSRARKSSVSNGVSKSQTSPADHELSPTSQANQVESEEEQTEQSDNANVLESQNSPVFVRDNNVDQSENTTDVVQLQSPLSVASGEATTTAVFESNINKIRDKNTEKLSTRVGATQSISARDNIREVNTVEQTRVKPTRSDPARENNARLVSYEENGAGASSSFDSMWAERWRELEEIENARRKELDKQMHDAKLKLEMEMNRAKAEHEILVKRREIERQQAELRQLEEIQQPQNTSISDTIPQNPLHESPGQLQYLLERQQNTMDEVVRGLRMPQREYMSFYGEPRNFPLFIKNFEVNVESKESNDADRLNYLIQYCKGKARQAIEHCIIMPPEEGYKRAKEILRKNFGRNHVVTTILPG